MPTKPRPKSQGTTTRVVGSDIFKQVFDLALSLPGKHHWVTKDEDVRTIEKLLGIPEKSIGAPLWVSGDTRHYPMCGRENELAWHCFFGANKNSPEDAAGRGHPRRTQVRQRRSAARNRRLECSNCKAPIVDLRSFKCHNWAYAREALLEVIEEISE